ncbi:hypothetical protein ABVG11_00450 [Streptomyces sp. HD1123-B1]|uniref:hypothetical protein n=1 Tax=Streptomyces huangiella TaxID=3228804 RepID=UPI003D7D77B7
MNTTLAGLLTGLVLGFAAYFGGFGAFLVVAALGLVGLVVGHLARGDVHLHDYIRTRESDGHRGETFQHHRTTSGPHSRTDHQGRVQ